MISDRYKRPRSYDDAVYQWHLGRVPRRIRFEGKEIDNPAFKHAIFVVHGMGMQRWAETAAALHSGFEDALEEIHKSRRTGDALGLPVEDTPPPYIGEGYWGNYDDLGATFPEEAQKMDSPQRDFFPRLWQKRSLSALRTFFWFLRQQLKLLNPSVIWKVGLFAWLLYIPLQVVSCVGLLLVLIRFPKVMAQVLNDVRLYVSPEGIIERAIVQRIDKRVGADLLQMIGVDWNFSPLNEEDKIQCNGASVEFTRIIWVAHSLGSIVSYNVLSDLFSRADEIEKSNTASRAQREGVRKFRSTLRRFVTIGSPLDKIAFLTGREALRPLPDVSRSELLNGGETVPNGEGRREWWVNFYHVLDPVSGALSNPSICGDQPPLNYHIGLWKLPGIAHLSYWNDKSTLRYILSRGYGKEYLEVPTEKPFSAAALTAIAFVGYFVWMEITLLLLVGISIMSRSLAEYVGLKDIAGVIDVVTRIVKMFIPFIGSIKN